MLARLIRFSLDRPGLVIALAGLTLLLAGLKAPSMSVDVFPELNAPTVVIMTEAGGLAADEVELNVTFPIEAAVAGLPGTRRVRSASATSLSFVWVEFDWGSDLYRARQMVAERLAAAQDALPESAHAEITPITSITGEIMLLALSSPDGSRSGMELRSLAEFDLRPRLLAVPGVAHVVAIGGELPQYQVHARPDDLALYGLSISDVVDATAQAHSTASAGYLENAQGREVPIRQMARVRSPADIASTIMARRDGANITVGQVADVALGPAPRRGTAADRGAPAVVISVQKSPGTNTLELTRRVDAALDQAEKALPAGVRLNRDPFRAARFIERSVGNVLVVLRDATIIVGVVLVLFLMNWRTTLITLTALPLSLAVALLVLWAWGMSINVMTLGGLAVAVGELVDDAIIDVENVYRRLRENAALAEGARLPLPAVVLAACNEVRSSVVFATVIICMVFAPLLFLEGLEGRFFRPLGVAYIVSIMASLLVALTVTPAMCRLLLRVRAGAGAHGDGRLVRLLKRAYEPLLLAALRARGGVLAGAGVLTALALALGSTFGTSFLPSFNEGTFTIYLMAPPGTSLVESDRLARGVDERLAGIAGVRSVTRRTGRAERDEHAEPVSSSDIEVTLAPDADRDAVRRGIDQILATLPGVTTMVGQPIEHRLSHVLSGTPAAIAINVFGDDLTTLRGLAGRIEAELRALPGTRDVTANREVMVTSLPVRYRHEDLAAAALTPALAARQVQQSLLGETVATVSDGARRVDLVVRLHPDARATPADIAALPIVTPEGARVPLAQVASIGPQLTSNLIARENARRKAVVSVNVADGYNLGGLVEAVRERVDPIVAAAGCTVSYGGQFEAQQSAARTIYAVGAVVALAMLMLLNASTRSLSVAVLVMLNLPLSLIGGIAAVYLTAGVGPVGNAMALLGLSGERYVPPVVSIASMVGFITLFGIAVRNGILLVNHYDHLLRFEHASPAEAIVRGSLERLSPILMTALTAALGLFPLAMAMGEPGSELLAPLAVVVLGGLASSTLLNLFVIPAGYALIAGVRFPRPARIVPAPSRPPAADE